MNLMSYHCFPASSSVPPASLLAWLTCFLFKFLAKILSHHSSNNKLHHYMHFSWIKYNTAYPVWPLTSEGIKSVLNSVHLRLVCAITHYEFCTSHWHIWQNHLLWRSYKQSLPDQFFHHWSTTQENQPLKFDSLLCMALN